MTQTPTRPDSLGNRIEHNPRDADALAQPGVGLGSLRQATLALFQPEILKTVDFNRITGVELSGQNTELGRVQVLARPYATPTDRN